MSGLLILTEPRDFHAFAVAEVLRSWGVEPTLWFGTDFPIRQQASIWAHGSTFGLEVDGPEIAIRDQPFQAVWNRRPSDPVLPRDLHPADREPAARDCQHFAWSLWHLVAPAAAWVNPLSSLHCAVLKPLQLRLAALAGLEIPPSLCSNDPRRIREFLRSHPGETLYKDFYQGSWKTAKGRAAVFTRQVAEADLPEDDMVRASPGIFQVRIAKAHELRVTFLGDRPVAARIDSQQDPQAALDWRQARSPLNVEPAALPAEIVEKCRGLMARLGLAFAAFDFIVTPDGRCVFLELNPMGQFLFIERLCPAIPLLDQFCRFLLERAGLSPPAGAATVHLAEIRRAAEQQMRAAAAAHEVRASSILDETGNVASETESELEAQVEATGSR